MNKDIDYINLISRKQRINSIGEIIIHSLSGGEFNLSKKYLANIKLESIRKDSLLLATLIAAIFWYQENKQFSDKCSCNKVNRCNKYFPIILSNN